MIYAEYDLETGFICGTLRNDSPVPEGRARILVPDYTDGGSYRIDLATLQPVLIEISDG